MIIRNPIIPGYFPDPSVCRVGRDFYLVNSSFEYFPGVPVHHSRNLVDWRQIGNCLTRASQLPLAGAPASDGIYAPTIRYHDGLFYMVTTNIRGGGNFFVTTADPAGEWSEPVWLEQGGIDPSLLFEGEKTYLTTNGTNWSGVRGIFQCEIDRRSGRQLTPTRFIWPGTGGAYPEAPHLFRRGEFYYLCVAEGGTAECHMVTMARSRQPYGPFESCPHNPVLTHRSLMNPIQATGHADFFEDARGDWWAVFLGIRYGEFGWHHLGRETFLAPVDWTADGWPVVNGGHKVKPLLPVDRAPLGGDEPVSLGGRDDFDAPALAPCYVQVRNPEPDAVSLAARPGFLRLHCGVASPDDTGAPSFVGRRQQAFACRAATVLEFEPASEAEEAGLIVRLDDAHHIEIAVTLRAGRRSVITRRRIGSLVAETACVPVEPGAVELVIEASPTEYALFLSRRPEPLDKSPSRYLSTQVAGGYTGVVIGMYATARGTVSQTCADFDSFDIQTHP